MAADPALIVDRAEIRALTLREEDVREAYRTAPGSIVAKAHGR